MPSGLRFAAAILSVLMALAQGPRQSWKLAGSDLDLDAHLTGTLADAKLSESQRAVIYAALDNKSFHDSFTNPEDLRKAIMATHVGSISVTTDGTRQILTAGPGICNGAANFCIRLFALKHGQPHQILDTSGLSVTALPDSTRGHHDLIVPSHLSGWDTAYHEFRWDGSVYKPSDCYVVKFDRNDDPSNPKTPPAIVDCN